MTRPLSAVKISWWNFSYIQLWREAWQYAGGQRIYIILCHAMFFVSILFDLATPYLLGQLVNTLQRADARLFQDSALYLGLIIFCSFASWLFHGPARVLERRAAQAVFIAYMTGMFQKLTELPLSWHQDHHSGNTINRIRTAAGGLKDFVQTGFVSFQGVITLAGSLAVLLWYSPVVGAVSLTGFILSMLLLIALNKRMTKAIHDANEAGHIANATFFDFVSNIASIVILRLQKFSQNTLLSKLNLSTPAFMREVRINEWRYFIYTMLHMIMLAVILLGYIWFQLQAGTAIAAGTLMTVYLYQEKVGGQGFNFFGMHSDWLNALTNLRATQTILDDHAKLAKSEIVMPSAGWKNLELKHLNFLYPSAADEKNYTLTDIHLPIRHGERIALIGGSGAGKSTLLSLLRGLHDSARCEVFLDGQKTVFGILSQLTTLIPQDPEIFENTIRFNVSFGLDVPDSTVKDALALAEFMPVLMQMPSGLDTDIREKGVNLSVGQKQRLALARGIFAAEQSDIVLLDEPTSSVDLPTEEKIFDNLFRHFKEKALIMTLHRLHLLPKFDRIIYLDEGRITSDLPAHQALSQPGPIFDLYNAYQKNMRLAS